MRYRSWALTRHRGAVPGRFDPGTLSLPGNPVTDGPARIEPLTVEGERGWITIRTRDDAAMVASGLFELAGYGLTGFGHERLGLLTGHGWINIKASGVPTGVITPAAGDETHLSGEVHITRDGAPEAGFHRTPKGPACPGCTREAPYGGSG